MLIDNEATMKNIEDLALTLSTPQLEQFVRVIESLAGLLQVANKDTEKAYRMYLNSIQPSEEKININRPLSSVEQANLHVSLLKH